MTVLRSFARTDPGTRRSYNEDALVNRPDIGLFAVADGAGGHHAGEVASAAIKDALEAIPEGLAAGQLLAETRARLLAVHEMLRAEAGRRGPDIVMASTVVVLLARGEHYAALWVGDSRIYLLRGAELSLLTSDHSLVQEMVDAGHLSADEAEAHPQANIITRAVGAGDGPLGLDKVTGAIVPGDRFLLCSDGLSKTLSSSEVTRLLGTPAGLDPTEMLISAALAQDVTDNVTVVVVEAG